MSRFSLVNQVRNSTWFSVAAMLAVLLIAPGVWAGGAGLLKGGAQDLPPITLSSGAPLADAPYDLESGKYYAIDIVCDGSAELAISGPEFFRNIWINEVVINDIEVRPLGLDSLEFDDEGTATIKFVAIRPGSFVVRIPGTTGESQQAIFNIR
ncbi:MAG: hypothetical protein V3U76_11355 [Granulosicoccus sp.]